MYAIRSYYDMMGPASKYMPNAHGSPINMESLNPIAERVLTICGFFCARASEMAGTRLMQSARERTAGILISGFTEPVNTPKLVFGRNNFV